MLVEVVLLWRSEVDEHETVVLEPDVFVSISVKGNMVAVAGVYWSEDADETFDVGVGISNPADVEAIVQILAAAIAAFNEADWQLVLPFPNEGDETETAPPF